jgi:hypothetical protein
LFSRESLWNYCSVGRWRFFFIYVQVPVVLKILDINSKKKYGSCIYNPRHPGLKGGCSDHVIVQLAATGTGFRCTFRRLVIGVQCKPFLHGIRVPSAEKKLADIVLLRERRNYCV